MKRIAMFNNSIHKNILIQILKDIYTNTDISPYLGFKGGTAVYVFYKLNRFSVDLDFDLLDDAKKQRVFDVIESILRKYGVLKDARIKRYCIFFLLSYEKNHLNIKVEINLRKFGSQYELKNYLGIAMLVMKQEDIFAHKLVAMYERMGKANRDIYDVHYFLEHHWPVNKLIVEERVGMNFDEFINEIVTRLSKLNQRKILHGVGELLDAKQKIWVKKHLVKDTIFLLSSRWLA